MPLLFHQLKLSMLQKIFSCSFRCARTIFPSPKNCIAWTTKKTAHLAGLMVMIYGQSCIVWLRLQADCADMALRFANSFIIGNGNAEFSSVMGTSISLLPFFASEVSPGCYFSCCGFAIFRVFSHALFSVTKSLLPSSFIATGLTFIHQAIRLVSISIKLTDGFYFATRVTGFLRYYLKSQGVNLLNRLTFWSGSRERSNSLASRFIFYHREAI